LGGVQYSSFLLAEYLMLKEGVEIEILLPNSGPLSKLLTEKSIPIKVYNSVKYKSTAISILNDQLRIPNPIAWGWNMIAILLNIIRIKKNIKPKTDLVISKGLLNHFTSGLACKSLNFPVIFHLQDLITNRYFGIMKYVFNIFARFIPSYIICDGESIQKSLGKNNKNNSIVILNGIKSDYFIRDNNSRLGIRSEFNIPEDAYVIGHVARITPWKGQDLLLKAFINYSRQNTNAYLLLIGAPLFDNNHYSNSIIKIIESHSLMHRVIMPGYRNDLQAMYSAMDLFLYPPIEKDTSPLALLSAISSGLPVGVSNIDSLTEIVDKCNDIDTFNPKNIDEMSALMKKYENDKIRKKIGLLNREAGRNNFDILVHGKKIEHIIQHVYNSGL
jgi:glycosyltransferase involved in cell wall biosynthesis